jgi:hypothetical protein
MGHMFFVFFNSLTTMTIGGFYGTFNPSNLITAPRSTRGCFYKKFSIEQLTYYFRTPQKILKYYSISFKVKRLICRAQGDNFRVV